MKMNKKTLNKVFLNWWLHGQSAWNYENMQGLGYCNTVLPALKEIYKDDDDALQEAVANHLKFFNCGFYTAPIIIGSTIAIEEKEKLAGAEVVTSIKTGLMGPLAGIHDTLFQVVVNTIFGAIAAYMAIEGNPIGIALYVAAKVAEIFISHRFLHMAYNEGTKLVASLGDKLKNITSAANVLGMTVIGALIPNVVKANVILEYTQGEVKMNVQELLDKIMPSLVPLLVVLAVYKISTLKKMTTVKTTFVIVAVSLVMGFFGIMG